MLAMNQIERLPIDSDLLQTFKAIADSGNLTLAADRLGRTQSAISVQLRKLETGLGATLFKRTARGMELTPAGEILLPKARSILDDIADASALFAEPLTGSISVGLPDDFQEQVLEGALSGFARLHPGVQVNVVVGCTSRFPEDVRNGSIDLAVYSGPDNEDGETLSVEETVWASAVKPTFDSNESVPLAILERNCWWKDLPTNALKSAERRFDVVFRSSSFSGLQSAIRAGTAVGVLPKSCLTGELTALTTEDGFPQLPVSRRSFLIAPLASQDLVCAMMSAIRAAHQEDSMVK